MMRIIYFVGMDGKERSCTFPKEGNRYIYKERKKSLKDWTNRLYDLLLKAKFDVKMIPDIIMYFVEVKGYWKTENYFRRRSVFRSRTLCRGGIKIGASKICRKNFSRKSMQKIRNGQVWNFGERRKT